MKNSLWMLVLTAVLIVVAVALGYATQEQNDQIGILSTSSQSSFVLFADKDKLVVAIHPDGKVEFGPDYTPDEASREFWKIVEKNFPCKAATHE